jgi:hypothetical protein
MTVSRRRFMQWAAALSAAGMPRVRAGEVVAAFRSNLLPSQQEIWEQQTWMARLGPKYTGNSAHSEFVEFLATGMKQLGLEVERVRYTFPRWEAKRSEIHVQASGGSYAPRVTSYFPYSGQTGARGVSGELVYAGVNPNVTLDNVRGKVVLIDCPVNERRFSNLYRVWGLHAGTDTFPESTRPARGPLSDLTPIQKAGAVAVILAWTDISDANAEQQYSPFSRPPQGIPALYVGRSDGERLRALAGSGAPATVMLEAGTFPDSPTDTLIATLPGASADEVIMLNTHTDGPNATEENGALGLLALAKYFSRVPRSDRRRTLVFPMTTGHFAGPWVPSIRGVIEKYPELIRKTVAAVTVEHLGCREWLDVPAGRSIQYTDTGRMEWSVAITPSKPMAEALLAALQGSRDRAGVVNPVNGGFLGEGSSLSRAGIPTIGYIPQPNYLLAGPADGCIGKLSPELMHSQIEVFARLVHRLDTLTAAELRA